MGGAMAPLGMTGLVHIHLIEIGLTAMSKCTGAIARLPPGSYDPAEDEPPNFV
jgi:hypothetical protein